MHLPKLTTAFLLWTLSSAVVVVALLWLIWPRSIVVQTASIDRGEVRRELTEEGRVRVRDVFEVTAPVGGLLKRIELEAGDSVEASDIVARIVPAEPALLDARIAKETSATVAAARSAIALAEADLALAHSEEQRTTQLFERGFAAKAALDRTRANLSAAKAVVNQRKAELQRALAAAGRPGERAGKVTPIKSPSSGKVLRVLQESETVVTPGTPLLEIGDPAQIEVVAEFLSQDAALMKEGARASIENWGGGEPLAARVKTIEPYARTKISALGVEEQRVNVVVSLLGMGPEAKEAGAAGEGRLGHGYRVDVRVVVFEEANALRAPTDALVRQGEDGWAVFRVVGGRARLTPVSVGNGDDRFRVVRDGLKEGDRVVLFPGDALKDGDLVRPAK